MSGAMKKIWGLYQAPDYWRPIAVDVNGVLKIADTGGLLKASDLSIDVNKYLNTNVKNFPANYPDSAVLSKLVEILTELNSKLETADLNIDGSKDLQVDVKSQTEKDRQLYGYDGAAWQKLGLLFGYNDTYAEAFGYGAYMDGSNFLMGEAVPAGYIYVITHLTGKNVTRAPTAIHFGAFTGSQIILGTTFNNPGLDVRVGGLTHIILKEGQMAVCQIDGCLTDDLLFADFIGYKMKIS